MRKTSESENTLDEAQDTAREDKELLRIACGIKEMPDLDPPAGLLPSIMLAVREKKRPWWYRAYRWARAPRSITFTPLQAAPFAAMALAVFVLASVHVFSRSTDSSPGSLAQFQDRVPVVLSLKVPEARSVAVIGSFNNWHPQKCEMTESNGDSSWTVTLWLSSGRYEYAFLIDGGKIIPDPHAGLYQDDGFGNMNTVLVVGNRDENAG